MRLAFRVLPPRSKPSSSTDTFTLVEDRWDDYTFKTTFHLSYTDPDGVIQSLGLVKIASFGMGDERASTKLPKSTFATLGEEFFSLGQDREYYENLLGLGDERRKAVLVALRDIALDAELYEKAILEPVTAASLLRDVEDTVITSQFRRIAEGHAPRTDFHFSYALPQWAEETATQEPIEFHIEAEASPSTNVRVVIGANGAGKSTMMRNFAASLRADSVPAETGVFSQLGSRTRPRRRIPFDNLVTVSFSAFDQFPENLRDPNGKKGDVPHHVIGLRGVSDYSAEESELAVQFATTLRPCIRGPRRERWLIGLKTLASAHPILERHRLETLVDAAAVDDEVVGARKAFDALSSGHKIVLLTMTALVRYVEERSLVLIDEPETHLHPPLLSALIRVLTGLMNDRNGVAFVATHSPVVLQEVPRSCALILRRRGNRSTLRHPRIETLGESLSVLTSEVFGLNVTDTAYHELLDRYSMTDDESRLRDQLGGEALAILRALDDEEDEDAEEDEHEEDRRG